MTLKYRYIITEPSYTIYDEYLDKKVESKGSDNEKNFKSQKLYYGGKVSAYHLFYGDEIVEKVEEEEEELEVEEEEEIRKEEEASKEEENIKEGEEKIDKHQTNNIEETDIITIIKTHEIITKKNMLKY